VNFFCGKAKWQNMVHFVTKGFLRSYVIDNKGKEHIIQFAPENWWIGGKSPESPEAPSAVFIDAIEDTEVLLIDLKGHNTMMERVAGYAASFRAGIERRSAAKDKRIVHSLTASAEERYGDFLATYPSIAQSRAATYARFLFGHHARNP
jgi:hypothetical protein